MSSEIVNNVEQLQNSQDVVEVKAKKPPAVKLTAAEKEERKKQQELEKREKEEKKRLLELEKEEKRKQQELEKLEKEEKRRLAELEKEEKRRRLEQEKLEKEEKKKQLELEKELKKQKQEQEKLDKEEKKKQAKTTSKKEKTNLEQPIASGSVNESFTVLSKPLNSVVATSSSVSTEVGLDGEVEDIVTYVSEPCDVDEPPLKKSNDVSKSSIKSRSKKASVSFSIKEPEVFEIENTKASTVNDVHGMKKDDGEEEDEREEADEAQGGDEEDENEEAEIEGEENEENEENEEDDEDNGEDVDDGGKDVETLTTGKSGEKSEKKANATTKKATTSLKAASAKKKAASSTSSSSSNTKKLVKPKLTVEEQTEMILEYMKQQNRPYSAQNVYDNLHAVIPKPQVEKLLIALSEENKMIFKEYGKAKVFLIAQNGDDDDDSEGKEENENIGTGDKEKKKLSPEEMDEVIEKLRSEQQAISDRIRELKQNFRQLANVVTANDMERREQQALRHLQKAQLELQEATATLHKNNTQNIDHNDLIKVNYNLVFYENKWRQAKKVCERMADALCESMQTTRVDLFCQLAIDTDEDWNVSLQNSSKK